MLRNRLIWLILWIASLVGISFYGGAVSYGFFWILTLIPLTALFYLLCVYIAFKVFQQLDNKDLVAGHTEPFLFILKNETFFIFSSVRVRLFPDFSEIEGQTDQEEYELFPGTGIRNETTILCRYRGSYEVGVRDIRIQDPLRLFTWTYRNPAVLRVTVKPDLIRLNELKSMDLSLMLSQNSSVDQTEPDMIVRKYEPGDDMRFIHWKASARSGELMSRKRIGEEQQGISVLFTTWRTDKDPMDYIPKENKVLETALAVSSCFVSQNTPVTTLYLNDTVGQYRADRTENFDETYQAVCLSDFMEENTDERLFTGAADMPALFESRAVVMVLEIWTPEAMTLSELLNRNNVSVMVYLISDDAGAGKISTELPRTEFFRIGTDDRLEEVL